MSIILFSLVSPLILIPVRFSTSCNKANTGFQHAQVLLWPDGTNCDYNDDKRCHIAVASWQGGREGNDPPLNFSLSVNFLLVGNFFSKNTKFESENFRFFCECKGKIKHSSTDNLLCRKFWAVCQKTATFCPPLPRSRPYLVNRRRRCYTSRGGAFLLRRRITMHCSYSMLPVQESLMWSDEWWWYADGPEAGRRALAGGDQRNKPVETTATTPPAGGWLGRGLHGRRPSLMSRLCRPSVRRSTARASFNLKAPCDDDFKTRGARLLRRLQGGRMHGCVPMATWRRWDAATYGTCHRLRLAATPASAAAAAVAVVMMLVATGKGTARSYRTSGTAQ